MGDGTWRITFPAGPTPASPDLARQLGWYQRDVEVACESGEAFARYVPSVGLPELVALVRALGRDCTYRYDATSGWVLLMVSP